MCIDFPDQLSMLSERVTVCWGINQAGMDTLGQIAFLFESFSTADEPLTFAISEAQTHWWRRRRSQLAHGDDGVNAQQSRRDHGSSTVN